MVKEFDLDKYLQASHRLDLTGIRWDEIKNHPLSSEEARCLTYMMDIESHTIIYLRDLLATRAAYDPDVTAFLACWVYEEMWHGEAFSRFLGEAGYRSEPDHEINPPQAASPFPSRQLRNRRIRRKYAWAGTLEFLGTIVCGILFKDFVALHMTWGAINELSTLSSYERLIATTRHPVLIELLGRIIKDERRHFAFYYNQAELRLGRGHWVQRITRWAIQKLWAPVGTGVRPQAETDFVMTALFGKSESAQDVATIDQTIAALPGFQGLRLIETALQHAARRLTVASSLNSPALSS